jgi:protein phosphatase
MGGEAGGAIASGLAAESIVRTMAAHWDPWNGEVEIAAALTATLEGASTCIKHRAREEPAIAKMGTTATLVTLAHGSLLCAQVGDSRAYVMRGGVLHQVTEDQTMAEMLRKNAGLPREQIRELVGANVILQALGCSSNLDVVLTRTALAHRDLVLLCSDGLFGPVDDVEIASVLRAAPDLAQACDALVMRANANGGPDNVSCVLFRVCDESLPPPSAGIVTDQVPRPRRG